MAIILMILKQFKLEIDKVTPWYNYGHGRNVNIMIHFLFIT